jgi:hypothetical protein
VRGAASLGSPVDRRGVDSQCVGDGAASVALNLHGEVGDRLARAGDGRPPAALLQGRGGTAGGRTHAGNEVRQGAPPSRRWAGLLQLLAHLLDKVGTAEDPLIPQVGLASAAERGHCRPAPLTAQEPAALQFRPAALRNAGGHECPAGTGARGAEMRENGRRVLPGMRDAAQEGAVTAPRISIEGPEVRDDLRAERVQVQVADELHQVRLGFRDDGFVEVL